MPTDSKNTVQPIVGVGEASNSNHSAGMLLSLFAAYRGRILFTYGLFNLENLLRLVQPFVLGLAINDLLRSSYRGLLLLVLQHLSHMLVGSLRQMYDTRAFTSIYTDLATQVVFEQRERDVDISRVAARSALSREYVDFFEGSVPIMMYALYSVVGALLMLGLYDWMLVIYCLALVIPAFALNYVYSKKTLFLNNQLNDQLEQEVEVISRFDRQEVRNHYGMLARWRIKLSDWGAVNFSLMEMFVLGLMVLSLVRFCTRSEVDAGDIVAMFQYVLMFVGGLDSIPILVEQMSRLRDIGRRIMSARLTSI
jgi:hypothetical protein